MSRPGGSVDSQIRLGVALLIVFLALWVLHQRALHAEAERRATAETSGRLAALAELLATEIEAQAQDVLEDPTRLAKLARERGFARARLIGADGTTLVDSRREASGEDALARIAPRERAAAAGGSVVVIPPPASDGMQSLLAPVFIESEGGDLLLRLDAPAEISGVPSAVGLLARLFGVAAVVVLGYSVVGRLAAGLRAHRAPEAGTGESAMIDTFQNLVRQLKDKETRMQELRTRAEERAAHVESYNESILQSVSSGVITFNRERAVTTFNHAAEQVLGLARAAAIGRRCDELFGAASRVSQILEAALAHGTAITRQEFELAIADGARIWVGVSTSLLYDTRGQVIGATFVFTDLTEIRHLQEQVELQRRLSMLGEMSAGIAHEFRNMMGTMMGFAKLIAKKTDAADARRGMVDALNRELEAMDRLIEQLLAFGRRSDLNPQPLQLDELLRRVAVQVAAAAAPQPKLELDLPPGLPPVMLDDVLIRQAFTNLLQNAVEAMPHGGTLAIRMRVVNAPARGAGGRQAVLVEISDTGVGIPKEVQDKIFLPFFTTKEKGTGMGLALVHKIILSHNGRIEVESGERQGTTFRIYLPAAS